MSNNKFYKTNWFMWLMVVLFWPVGLIMLWTKKDLNFSKKTKGIISGVVVVVFIVIGALGGNETPTDKAEATNTEVKVEKSVEKPVEPVKELTFEEQVSEIAIKSAGKDNFVNVVWDDDTKTNITVNLKMKDNFTGNMIKTGMINDAQKILKDLSSNDTFKGLKHITIVHETEFVDKLGNKSTGNAGIISIDVDMVLKIKWENFLSDNLPDLCTSYYIHPSLIK